MEPVFAFIGGISPMEMMVVGVIALLLFGKRLPEVARSLGKGVTEFKRGIAGIEDDVSNANRNPPQSRPLPQDERSDVSAPKFEPPKFEPGEGN